MFAGGLLDLFRRLKREVGGAHDELVDAVGFVVGDEVLEVPRGVALAAA